MDIIVKDTNILIDLFVTGLIRHCHLLNLAFHTTKYVIGEIEDPDQNAMLKGIIANGMLQVDSFNGEEFMALMDTIAECEGQNNLSHADCSVMLLAQRYGCRLLTADRKLRVYAEGKGVTVSGFLWLADKMVKDGAVSPSDMARYLQVYLDKNPRAPEAEVMSRIEKYKS